jgi:hypothetical protein
MVTLLTMIKVVKQWIKLWDLLLHKFGFKCHTAVWLALYPNLTLHCPTSTGTSFAFTLEIWASAIFNGWSYEIKAYGIDVTFNGMTAEFHGNLPMVWKVILLGAHWRTDRAWWSHKPHVPLLRNATVYRSLNFQVRQCRHVNIYVVVSGRIHS